MRPIDADEVTKDLALFKYSTEYGEAEKAYIRALNKCSDEIEDAPTLDMKQVVHAHWIKEKKEHQVFMREIYKCSNCGHFLDFSGVNAGRGSANYCPSCGAKMDEETESNHE